MKKSALAVVKIAKNNNTSNPGGTVFASVVKDNTTGFKLLFGTSSTKLKNLTEGSSN
jgi:hypothetical protein